MDASQPARKPSWIRARLPSGDDYARVAALLRREKLPTVCEGAKCPNLGECWSRGTATFLILGKVCTRACGFCSVGAGNPQPPEADEPFRVARAVHEMKLAFAVITSVDRDDLPDGGAAHWAGVIRAVKKENPGVAVEALVPDFSGSREALDVVLGAMPDVISHNLETVESLSRRVRSRADYARSLEVLRRIAAAGLPAKTGIMLGLGETADEIRRTLEEAWAAGARILTIGQYLQPTPRQLPVHRWVAPEEFARWAERALAIGFLHVESAPLVRSSYFAERHFASINSSPIRVNERPAP